MILSSQNLETLRSRPQQTKLYLSIYEPQIVFQARINNGAIARGARVIAYDTVSLGAFSAIKAGATMWIGTTPGGNDVGKIRVRSATSSNITVSENSDIEWADDLYLTVFYHFELWAVFPRIIQDPADDENVIFYKDYDIPYTNQNSLLGTFINMGPNRAASLEPSTNLARLWYTASGTHNVLGHSVSYDWWFQGASITGSTAANPGYINYPTAGNFITRLTVTDNTNGAQDTSYRTVRIHSPADPPVQKWQLTSLGGSRDEGGYTASFRVFEDIPISEHAVVVIYAENWYGTTRVDLGGNYQNSGNIFWTGYVDQDTIKYDYEHSEVVFNAHSITGMMKESSGFSVSVQSKASPSKWFELLDMNCEKAIYHYLRWHTTALNIADFKFEGDDYKIQFFDADRESMFDAIDNLMRSTLWGKVVSDRQGKVWMEVNAEAYQVPSASFPPVMEITSRDWMNEPVIEERLSEEVAFIEMGGIAYSGVVTGTFSALLGAAPGNTPGFHGSMEVHEGLALLGQNQLNYLVGNVLANRNSPFPSVDMEMAITALNLDIAPQEGVELNIAAGDTVRNRAIDALYIPNTFSWTYYPEDSLLLPRIDFKQIVDGEIGETIVIPPPEEQGTGFVVPPIQIPPLPPLTIPAFSIPTGTISAIVTSQIIQFQSDYYMYEMGGTSAGRNVDLNGVIDLGGGVMTVTLQVLTAGLYYASLHVSASFSTTGGTGTALILGPGGQGFAINQGGAGVATGQVVQPSVSAVVVMGAGNQISLGFSGSSGGLGWTVSAFVGSLFRISA